MKKHLPEDIGDSPEKLGQKGVDESYSGALGENLLFPYAGAFPQTDSDGNIVYLPSSENITDTFALFRLIQSEALFANVSRYGIDSAWAFQVADSAGDLPLGQEAIIWTDRVNFRASYPGSVSEVKFAPAGSAILARLLPFSNAEGLQQAIIFSRRNFAPIPGSPMLITMGVQMTVSSSDFCIKEWGWFSNSSGYFFRVRGDGVGDKFSIVYRGNQGEVEIPRSQFNVDRIDGSGASRHTQSFTNIGMFGIEVGTSGVGARFWSYVATDPLPRWVMLHHITQDSDNSPDRLVFETGLPISFVIKNSRPLGTTQTLTKYGCSATSIGPALASIEPVNLQVKKTHYDNRKSTVVFALRCKEFINNIRNANILINSSISFYSEHPANIAFYLTARNIIDRSVTWTNLTEGVEYNSSVLITELENPIATFNINRGGSSISLKEIFSLQRRFLSMQFSNDPAVSSNDPQFAEAKSEIWITYRLSANDNLADLASEQILWETTEITNFQVVYEGNSSVVSSEFSANLVIGEI